MQAPGKYRLLTCMLPAILLSVVLGLYYLISPNGFDAVTYTYDALYATVQACFPHVAAAAFAVLIIIPHLLAFALAYYLLLQFCHRFPLDQYIARWTIKCLNLYIQVVVKLGLFSKHNGYKTDVFRQLIASSVVMLLFIAGYYILKYYSGTSSFFNRQLLLSHILIAALVLQLITTLYICKENLLPFVKGILSHTGSPYNLALVRIAIFIKLFIDLFINYSTNSYWAGLPDNMRVGLPYMDWFIQNLPINPQLYAILSITCLVTCAMAIVGLFTRPAILATALLCIYVLGVPMFYGKLMHKHIWVWFPLILAFSRCADVLSIDSLIKTRLLKKEVGIAASPQYNLPLLFIWLHLGIIYFFAGLIKLKDCGLEWALGDSMINQIQVEWVQHYNNIPAIRIDHYPVLLHIGGIGVILFELYFFFLVLSAKGRIVAFVGGLSMHNIINYFMYIGFQDLQWTYASLVNWSGLRNRKAENQPQQTFSFSQLLSTHSYRLVFIISTTLLSINFIFGAFRIHSWPFSSYPTYSAIVPATHTYVYFEAYDSKLNKIDVYKEGKLAGFRMETFTPIEDRIAENVQHSDTMMVKTNTRKLWEIWKANVPKLSAVDSVAVYLRTSPVVPEKTTEILAEQYLLSYTFKNN